MCNNWKKKRRFFYIMLVFSKNYIELLYQYLNRPFAIVVLILIYVYGRYWKFLYDFALGLRYFIVGWSSKLLSFILAKRSAMTISDYELRSSISFQCDVTHFLETRLFVAENTNALMIGDKDCLREILHQVTSQEILFISVQLMTRKILFA